MVQVNFFNNYLSENNFEFSVIIKDTGPGIPKEKIKEIFNPFVSSQVRGGIQYSSGLGLAICNEFTHMLNGRINVESEVGKGSQFTLTIPYAYSYEKMNDEE
jgi:signal transduction histidine kinase